MTNTEPSMQSIQIDQHEGGISIGRDSMNDIVLRHPSVSRFHARIVKESDAYVLIDCGSANGVLLNGKRINEQQVLPDPSNIRVGETTFLFSGGRIALMPSAPSENARPDTDTGRRTDDDSLDSLDSPDSVPQDIPEEYTDSTGGFTIQAFDLTKKVSRKKQILSSVSCDIHSNEFVAIIGGSGAGKTTLMNAISGFDRKITGQVLYNGIDLHSNFDELKNEIGYVPQQDIVYENLSLEQMLTYAARLRMPKGTNRKAISQRISQVLETVELADFRKTYIRKLSGGQKKRASIAVELLGNPRVFFLDEPTSGLDPGTAHKLMQTLRKLASTENKTIIMVTHTTQDLELCDKVLFMGPGGRLCFAGTIQQAGQYFGTDDLVKVYNLIYQDTDKWAQRYEQLSAADPGAASSSQMPHAGKFSSDEARSGQAETAQAGRPKRLRRSSPPLSQGVILARRYLRLICHDWQRLLFIFAQPVLIALLLSIVASSRSEYMSGVSLKNYIFSKFFVQTLVALIQAVLLTGIFAWMAGVSGPGVILPGLIQEMMLSTWITIETAMSLGFVISSLMHNSDRALTIAPFALIIQLLFSGILFKLDGAAKVISRLTISKWSVEALGSSAAINDMPSSLQRRMASAPRTASSLFLSTPRHILTDWLILLGMALLCAVVCRYLLTSISSDGR